MLLFFVIFFCLPLFFALYVLYDSFHKMFLLLYVFFVLFCFVLVTNFSQLFCWFYAIKKLNIKYNIFLFLLLLCL